MDIEWFMYCVGMYAFDYYIVQGSTDRVGTFGDVDYGTA